MNCSFTCSYKQLTCLKGALGRWERSGSRTPPLELLSSELRRASEMKGAALTGFRLVTNRISLYSSHTHFSSVIPVHEDDLMNLHTDSSESDDPGRMKESRRLAAYVERYPLINR